MVTDIDRTEGLEIGELARESGVTVRTIRYYIQQGLLPSAEFSARATRYSIGHLQRLELIRAFQAQGLPLVEIRMRLGKLSDTQVAKLLATLGPAARGGDEAQPSTRSEPSHVGAPSAARQTIPTSIHSGAPGSDASIGRALHSQVSPGESAVDYVRRVMASLPSSPGASASVGVSPTPPSPTLPSTQRSAWERIILAPDVEVHVSPTEDPLRQKKVERLLDLARQILEANE